MTLVPDVEPCERASVDTTGRATARATGRRARLFATRQARPRERAGAFILATLIVIGCVVLASEHPTSIPLLPACPSKTIVGLDCPGCGSGRAVHHLLNLRVADAWEHNPAVFVLGLPFLALLAIDLAAAMIIGRRVTLRMNPAIGIGFAIVLIAYMVVRNLPFEALDGLRPPEPAVHAAVLGRRLP